MKHWISQNSGNSLSRVKGSFIASSIVLATILGLFVGYSFLLATPMGFRVYIADAPQGMTCGDSHDLVVVARGNHVFNLNEQGPLDANSLRALLSDGLKNRAEKVVWIEPESGVSYADFIESIDNAVGPDVHIGIVTDGVRKLEGLGGCRVLPGLMAPRWQLNPLLPNGLK